MTTQNFKKTNTKMKQKINIKLLVKLRKNGTVFYQMLQEAYRKDTLKEAAL